MAFDSLEPLDGAAAIARGLLGSGSKSKKSASTGPNYKKQMNAMRVFGEMQKLKNMKKKQVDAK